MYIILALLSAVFSSFTAILSKKGLKGIDSNIATFLRTCTVLVYVWAFAVISGVHTQISEIDAIGVVFLVLSGIAAGSSWLCYHKSLSLGEVSRVTAIDKSSLMLTMIIGVTFLNEKATVLKVIGIGALAVGTYLTLEIKITEMIKRPSLSSKQAASRAMPNHTWMIYAALSAVFAASTSVFAKIGLIGIDASLGTAMRTVIILIFTSIMLPITGSSGKWNTINKRSVAFIILSGLTTSLAWLCYFNALRLGDVSVVAPLDKLSTTLTVFFSWLYLKEKITKRLLLGILILTLGTILTLF